MHDEVRMMSASQCKKETELKDVKFQCQQLKEENKALLRKLESSGNAPAMSTAEDEQRPPPAKTLLIGDSIIVRVEKGNWMLY